MKERGYLPRRKGAADAPRGSDCCITFRHNANELLYALVLAIVKFIPRLIPPPRTPNTARSWRERHAPEKALGASQIGING